MKKPDLALRQEIIQTCIKMNAMGINQGTSGNVSVRLDEGILITPSAMPYDKMKPENIVLVDWEGQRNGSGVPSTEWRFHLDITKQRKDVGAIVHTHSMYATILAIRGQSIPAVHYMIAAAGGPTIRCGKYETFGTPELSQQALEALEGRNGCLLANHGVIATGANLAKALWLAKEIEVLAHQYVFSLLLGGPDILSDDEIHHVVKKFRDYGVKS